MKIDTRMLTSKIDHITYRDGLMIIDNHPKGYGHRMYFSLTNRTSQQAIASWYKESHKWNCRLKIKNFLGRVLVMSK